ncbi:hypothetical protein Syun_024690 [Stephania yunnanensis]|uniref:DUF659 domain-containing protein n=1 Tax=Stephania yunnanensis TaxID=152371 RepID=A0AAP0EQ71_9MAGN
MTNAIIECAPNNYKIPSCEELRGRILLDELQVIRRHVMAVKRSWVTTGCSVLLDGWTDGNGRTLINFLVDSPGGPIFLRSADVSGFHKDVNAMSSLLDGVIEEVGIENVVQVVAYSPSACMDALGKRLTQKHRSMFWTVCASHCIGLMLEKIEALALTKKILDKAKIITRFIYSHAMVLRLMRMHCGVRDMVRPSKIKSAASFLTLANIVSESKNLKSMFNSFAWNTSTWASTSAGKMVADLVGESSSFWGEAGMVLKATIPLVRVVQLLNGEDGKHQVGYIYETMDQAKEAIKMEFGNKKAKYLPLWKIIDEIWDNHLHSPIHSAGYYFNPSFFYSSHFFSDAEVASGLLCCIVRMVEDPNTQDLISLQMDEYRMAKGGFGEQNAVEQRRQISPAEWWSRYGGKCPELQRFAIRILSQTCSGGLRYQLRRSLSEQMHTHGRNNVEQQRLTDLTFVHHNLQLQQQQHSSIIDRYNMDIIVKDMDAMKDWVVAPDHQTCPNSSDSDWVFSDCNGVDTASGNLGGVVPPGFSLKQEAFGDI